MEQGTKQEMQSQNNQTIIQQQIFQTLICQDCQQKCDLQSRLVQYSQNYLVICKQCNKNNHKPGIKSLNVIGQNKILMQIMKNIQKINNNQQIRTEIRVSRTKYILIILLIVVAVIGFPILFVYLAKIFQSFRQNTIIYQNLQYFTSKLINNNFYSRLNLSYLNLNENDLQIILKFPDLNIGCLNLSHNNIKIDLSKIYDYLINNRYINTIDISQNTCINYNVFYDMKNKTIYCDQCCNNYQNCSYSNNNQSNPFYLKFLNGTFNISYLNYVNYTTNYTLKCPFQNYNSNYIAC